MTLSRNDILIRAAKIRAAVLSLLANVKDPISTSEIQKQLATLMFDEKFEPKNIASILTGLVNQEQIASSRDGTVRTYWAPAKHKVSKKPKMGKRVIDVDDDWDDEPAGKLSSQPKMVAFKAKSTAQFIATDAAPLQIDIVKNTGRVRISLKGLVIEIGVVD